MPGTATDTTVTITHAWIDAYYRAHHRSLAAYACTWCASRSEAEDLVHEVLVAMLAGSGEIRNPEAYVYRAIRNRAIDGHRRAVRLDAARSVEPARDVPELEALRTAMSRLSAPAAEVIVLHARSGLTFPQIALVLGEPVGTVSARYARGLGELRAMLSEEKQHG